MLTYLDIGIEVDSILEVFIPKNSELPYEFECELVMNNNNKISLYEGNRFYVKDNNNIGNYNVDSNGIILFSLKMDKNYILNVFINENKVDTIQCFQTIQHIENEIENIEQENEHENELKKLKESKKEYSTFIESSLSSIDELIMENTTREYLIERLNWAKQVLDIEDVSLMEYNLALNEIEGIVNPILNKFLNKPY
jgi:hypothetical protein